METQIISEIKQIKKMLSQLVGTSDLPAKQKFSKEALTNAAKEFRKLEIKRGEWIIDYQVSKIVKSAPYEAGKFIVEKFQFINYFRHGRNFYLNRKDLVALNKELKKRNIHLKRYMELLKEQEKFNKKVQEIKKLGVKKKRFKIPEELRDIELTTCAPPNIQIVKDHIDELMKKFKEENLSEYIDLYDTFAYLKVRYQFERYIDQEKLKICKKWCNDFNYANSALKEIINTKSY
jgi:mRNA-degrading endonuclease YafQ of YafQ-DinJ toxin-antitoxin module